MANNKLMKVMEYLINEQEDKARDLLHQIFIEKARAIHEEMMHDDPEMGGDHTEDLLKEIDAEEHMGEAEDMEDADDVDSAVADLSDEMDVDMESDEDDVSVEDDMEDMDTDAHMDSDEVDMDMDMDAEEVDVAPESDEDMEHKIMDLEAAIEELKKEFEALEDGDHEEADADVDADAEEDKVDESWETMDEADDFDDLEESIAAELSTITAPKGGEVGAGKFAREEANTHSPVPRTQKDQMGAKPVKTGEGKKASGYDREAAPSSHSLGAGTGRRKDAEDNKKHVSKEGDPSALLNKGSSEGFGAVNSRSPIQGR